MALLAIPGEIITLYATFKNRKGQLVAQPNASVRIERINPQTSVLETVLNNTKMSEMVPGRYYVVWHTPKTIELGTVIARYFGQIDGITVEGEDEIQVTERTQQRIVTNTAGIK
jgi:hypothetical protein